MTLARGSSRLGLVLVLAVSLGFWACSAENGTGFLQGNLDVPACDFKHVGDTWVPRKLTEVDPKEDLSTKKNWNYFVAQPRDASGPKFPADHPQNELIIRMQNRSGGWEAANALMFWVVDSYEVGRCLRQRTLADGTPDWDPRACDRATDEGRMLVGTEGELVTSHLVLQDSCPSAGLIGEAIGACDGGTCPEMTICPGRGSWISFSAFGSLFRGASTDAPLSADFKVNIGERIAASAFHVELCDQNSVEAVQTNVVPVPVPAIRGTLDGAFSFDLEPSAR